MRLDKLISVYQVIDGKKLNAIKNISTFIYR